MKTRSLLRSTAFATITARWMLLLLVVLVLILVGCGGAAAADATADSNQQCSGTTSDEEACSSAQPRSKSKYVATQFINFNINTIGGLASAGECEGLTVDPLTGLCYIGNQDSIEDDFLRRLQIVKIVLDRIAFDLVSDHVYVDQSPNVLKIFMVPEFFMRGPFGAYSTSHLLDDGSIFSEFVGKMKEFLADDIFQDVVFVFGTFLAAELKDGSGKKLSKDTPLSELEAKDLNYYNLSPVMKGGKGHNHFYTVAKHHIAMDDFLDRTSLPDPAEITFGTYTKMDERFHAKFTNIVEDNIIEMDGIRIGIEICLDHRQGALWTNLKKRNETDVLVDVQLITSGGMSIERGLNAIAPGGVVYLSDGVASSAACRRPHTDTNPIQPDKLCRDVSKKGKKRLIPTGGDGYSDYFMMTHCVNYPKPELLEGYYTMNQPQGCASTLAEYGMHITSPTTKGSDDTSTLPSIEFYPTVALPGNE